MNQETVGKITRTVVGQFPEMDGVKPAIRRQAPPGDSPALFLLTFSPVPISFVPPSAEPPEQQGETYDVRYEAPALPPSAPSARRVGA